MPVRSLTSSVLKWPSSPDVRDAVVRWAADLKEARGDVLSVGIFGSLARGGWGVGSDADIIVLLDGSEKDFPERALDFDTLSLPVPVDLLVYTTREWKRMHDEGSSFDSDANPVDWIF